MDINNLFGWNNDLIQSDGSPRGDCIRFDVPRRLFVDGELLAEE